MNYLKEVEIKNLWDAKELTLKLNNKVTFLTGMNGSGKSTILNVIFDTLNAHNNVTLHTSKNRFWSAKCHFEDELDFYVATFPSVDSSTEIEEKLIDLLNNAAFHDLATIQEFEQLCIKDKNIGLRKNITYSDDIKQVRNASLHYVSRNGVELSGDPDSVKEIIPNSFIYQEDRCSLHKKDKNLDSYYNSFYFEQYKNNIDDRLIYIRNSFQNYESQIAKKAADFIKEEKSSDELIAFIRESTMKTEELFSLLNSYLYDSGKKIAKDDDNMLTAKSIKTGKVIPWYLLSRGEKTLIYLFLACFIYQDSIFLLDEPEISLHVTWQNKLIHDLTNLAPNSQFIVATHSPDLIGADWLPNCLALEY